MTGTIESFMHSKVVVLHENNSTLDVARAMCENRIGCVVIADHQGHLTGIVTDRDLVCGCLAVNPDPDIPIAEVMTRDIFAVDRSASLEDVIELMKKNGIRRVPIVESTHRDRQKCVGLVSLDDLIVSQAVSFAEIARIAKTQIFRKQRFRHHTARHEGRVEQTMDRFVAAFARGLDLDDDGAYRMIHLVMSLIVQRLHYSGAAHVIAQMPQTLQDQLLDLPAGPDRSITAKVIVRGVAERLRVAESVANDLLYRFWQVLAEKVGYKQTHRISHQLPQDIQSLLSRDLESTRCQFT